jgi:hypothetical protein
MSIFKTLTKEKRYIVSDGVTGEWTIAGYFYSIDEAVKAFRRCHKIEWRNLLAYEDKKNSITYCMEEVNGKMVLVPSKQKFNANTKKNNKI